MCVMLAKLARGFAGPGLCNWWETLLCLCFLSWPTFQGRHSQLCASRLRWN